MPRTPQTKGTLVFGTIWILFSSIFVIIGLWTTYSSFKKSAWEETPCVVTEFKVKADQKLNPPFQPKVKFRYKFNNASYTGDRVLANSEGEEDFEILGELLHRYQENQIKTCYVNPETPEEASLLKTSKWKSLFGLAFTAFGGFFVLIGFFIISNNKKKKSVAVTQSNKVSSSGKALMSLFFSIFAIAGFASMFSLGKSALSSIESEEWKKTPAKVIWSRVITISSSDSTTYRPEVFFRYKFNGKTYQSNHYKRSKSSSSGRSKKQKIVDQYPKGKSFTCYVNPEKPWQAVIEPKLGKGWLWLLFPIPFIAVGIGGLFVTFLKKENKSITKKKTRLPVHTKMKRHLSRDQTTFTPGKKRLGWFIGAIAIAAFWNGIVSIFLRQVISDWQAGSPSWFETLFLTPFVIIGLAFILHIPYRLLAIFNPAPQITIEKSAIPIGTSTQASWTIPRGAHKISHFRIYLKGTEEAQYRRGTDTKTANSTFYEFGIIDTTNPLESASGSVGILLPGQANNIMPTWKGDHNSIIWTLEVQGKIPNWPDINESYPITVLPPILDSNS